MSSRETRLLGGTPTAPFQAAMLTRSSVLRSPLCHCRSSPSAQARVVILWSAKGSRPRQTSAGPGAGGHGPPHSQLPTYLFYGMFGLIVLLIPLTLYKVAGRWKKANAAPEIVEV